MPPASFRAFPPCRVPRVYRAPAGLRESARSFLGDAHCAAAGGVGRGGRPVGEMVQMRSSVERVCSRAWQLVNNMCLFCILVAPVSCFVISLSDTPSRPWTSNFQLVLAGILETSNTRLLGRGTEPFPLAANTILASSGRDSERSVCVCRPGRQGGVFLVCGNEFTRPEMKGDSRALA